MALVINYLDNIIAGRTLDSWILAYNPAQNSRNKIAWTLIHVCFACYHIFADPFVTTDEFEVITEVIEMFAPGILDITGHTFSLYLYHFVVGKYGHLPEEQAYLPVVRMAVDQAHMGHLANYHFNPDAAQYAIPYPVPN